MDQKNIIYLERKIAIGMIVSTPFIKIADTIIEIEWVQSKEARMIMRWCLEFYHLYKKAPESEIQSIYMDKVQNTNIQKDHASLIEDILENLSEDFEEEKEINIKYLTDQLVLYAKACKLNGYAEQIQDEVQDGKILEAEQMLINYKPPENIQSNAVTPLNTLQQHKEAFLSVSDPILKFNGDLGDMVNHTMTRESFVVLLGQNKVGKTFWLMKSAIQAAEQGRKVTFFQAGDMSQAQLERRIGIYFAKKSDLKKYCGPLYIPVLDCVYNLTGDCDLKTREGGHKAPGPLESKDEKYIIKELSKEELIEAFEDYPDHKPCYNCKRLRSDTPNQFRGSIWYKKKSEVNPLGWKECYKLMNKKYRKIMNRIRIITYSSEGLTMGKVNAELDILERSGFITDVCIMDYMDLLGPDPDTKNLALRDQENKKWQRARRLSQDKRLLLLSASQSDSGGFSKYFLSKENFSEDRRKLDHVTAMYGLNMTDKEKKKGVMRFNDIVGRETEGTSFVYVFNRLQMGQPLLGSFY